MDFAQWMADDDNPDGVKIVIRRKNEWAEDDADGETNFELAQKYPELVLGLADTATATATPKRIKSIVYSGFNLKAANGGMTARNTQMFSLAVKLPKLSALQASSK